MPIITSIFTYQKEEKMTLEKLMLDSEALIFASDKPLSSDEIANLITQSNIQEEDEQIDTSKLQSALEAIVEKYSADFYPFEVKQIGGGYQFLSKKDFYPMIAKLNGEKYTKRLSTAALETLAIIAYKQPVTKAEIEYIRGVNSDYSVQKLLDKELIIISGRLEDQVGKPLTFSTSKSFIDYLGLNSIDELPKFAEIVQQELVIPTDATEAIPENDTQLIVSENGELQEIPLVAIVNDENNQNQAETSSEETEANAKED
ncbi:MAG: SMC-Scp complex subunit ScpB [Chitinophagaceae bacterium]